jgi:DNA helicase II / ATP-dependent DNA helicase PcrA
MQLDLSWGYRGKLMVADKEKICQTLCGRQYCPDDISSCDGKKDYRCKEVNKSFIKCLNENQIKYIVSSINENIYLNACPGSGKTEVLGIKCAYENVLWNKKNVGFAVLTFTNSAEDEIQKRVESYIGEKLAYPHFVGTFTSWIHGYLANPFLSNVTSYEGNVDKDKSIKLIDNTSSSDFLNIYSCKYGFRELGHLKANEYFFDLKSNNYVYCGNRNRKGKAILDELLRTEDWRIEKLDELKKRFWKDGFYLYEDIEYLVLKLLINNDDFADILARRFPVIFIDECQDLSIVQLCIIHSLMKKGCSIHLIGDLNQSIYDFRNIYPEDTLKFINKLNFKELILNQNYRSCQSIVNTSNMIINKEENIIGCNENRVENPLLILLYKKDEEAEVVRRFYEIANKQKIQMDNVRVIARNNNLIKKLYGLKKKEQSSNILEDIARAIYLSHNVSDITVYKERFLLWAKSIRMIYYKEGEHQNSQYYYKPVELEMREWKTLISLISGVIEKVDELSDFSKTWTEWKKLLASVLKKNIDVLPELVNKEYHLSSIRSGNADKTIRETLFLSNNKIEGLKCETIHGCKGMSLDAVLFMSSYQSSNDSESGAYWRQWFDREKIDEKNRLAYVAFSRAKYLLALAIPKPSTFTKSDEKMLGDCGFKIIDI